MAHPLKLHSLKPSVSFQAYTKVFSPFIYCQLRNTSCTKPILIERHCNRVKTNSY